MSLPRYTLDHLDNVARTIVPEMVKAGVSSTVAPTPAREAARRIMAGEPAAVVIRDLVDHYRDTIAPSSMPAPSSTPEPEPEAAPARSDRPEMTHERVARQAGKTPPTARSTADRVKAVLADSNPWVTGNVTHQMLVSGLDPYRAAQLKRAAGH